MRRSNITMCMPKDCQITYHMTTYVDVLGIVEKLVTRSCQD